MSQFQIHPLINKLAFLVALTILGGCSTFQNTPSSRTEPQEPEEAMQQLALQKPEEAMQQLAPLLLEGTKPLIAQENFLPSTKDTIPPCVDARTRKPARFLLADLKSELIPLAYSNMERVMTSLEVMGVNTIEAKVPTPPFKPYTVNKRGKATLLPPPTGSTHAKIEYTCSDLPIFFKPKTTPVKSLTEVLTGPSPSTTGSRFSMVNMAPADYGLNEALIAFYHPDSHRRFDNIKKTISQTLDAAPIQVYIESMVLEVNETGVDELGVLYNMATGQSTVQFGATTTTSPSNVVSTSPFFKALIAGGHGATSVAELLSIQINALVAKGSAEVLSRPSIITLNNRPAVIEITEQSQFPVRTSNTTSEGTVTLAFSFEEVTPGIMLQLRPRVSDKKNEVALEIDVQVKALVTANDGVAINDNGLTVATKPGSSTRRVHTYALVPNKTPIIIGGLVSRDNENITNKLPWLGDLPLIGPLFGATRKEKERKEVIIVITPHIIRANSSIGIQSPKDTAMFDDSDMVLFRDSYRVRSEDVFDLGFVYRSQQFNKYRNYVVSRSERDKEFAKTPLAQSFSGAHFPGGDGLVSRMIYDIVGKRNLAKPVSREKIIITEHARDGNFKKITFLEKAWQKAQSKSVPEKEDGQSRKDYGLVLTFLGKGTTDSSVQPHAALRMLPLAEIAVLTEKSKHHKDSRRIFIASENDLKMIREAIVVREILKLNRSKHIPGPLNEFRKGTKLILPVIHETGHFHLDLEVATVYNQIKFYYQILEQSLRDSFRLIEEEIKKDKVNKRQTKAGTKATSQAGSAIRETNFTERATKPSKLPTKKVIKTPKATLEKPPLPFPEPLDLPTKK